MTATVAEPAGDDVHLVAAVRRGDDRAFEALYQRYHARIAAYVRGMVKDHARAEDITQEIFFSALRRMRETERPIAFKPWIYEIARNACIDAYRRTSRAEELSYDADGAVGAADLVSRGPSPDAAVDAKQRLDDLCGAFGGLSETHHRILVLRELEGLSYREIGERLGMSRPAVESTLFRARKRLTEEYDELVSGRRCERVQSIIAAAAEGMLGVRDKRRLQRHLASCQGCRRHARLLGVDARLEARPSLRERVAALLPIPAFLRAGRGADRGTVANLSSSMGPAAEPLASGLAKAAATAVALAIVTVGAGVAGKEVGLPVPGVSALPLVGGADDDGAADKAAPGRGPAGGSVWVSPTEGRAGSTAPSGSRRDRDSGGRSGDGNGSSGGGGSASSTSSSGGGGGDGSSSSSLLPSLGGGGGGGVDLPSVQAPSTSGTPDLPGTSGTPSLPQAPSASSPVPDVQTSTPSLPSVPEAPKLPDTGSLPSLP